MKLTDDQIAKAESEAQHLANFLQATESTEPFTARAIKAAGTGPVAAQEPVAWRCRQRGPNETEWQEWHVMTYKPQGPESPRFMMAPLYATPQPIPEGMALVKLEAIQAAADFMKVVALASTRVGDERIYREQLVEQFEAIAAAGVTP